MTASDVSTESPLGFLTVVEDRKHGLFGGYLVLNRAGRPLEFHCTAPVRANRAQEILYGPTLRPYLYGEQIGRTLLEQGKHGAVMVLTDCEPMLSVGEFITPPVILVGDGGGGASPSRSNPAEKTWRVDPAQGAEPKLHYFEVAGQRLAIGRKENAQGRDRVAQSLEALATSLDLSEPFERIRAAIDEARRGGQ